MKTPGRETCHCCGKRGECWWVYQESPWRLCAMCYEIKTGRAPVEPPAYLNVGMHTFRLPKVTERRPDAS